jgi:tetratricopeptide (TPR) repeat protein
MRRTEWAAIICAMLLGVILTSCTQKQPEPAKNKSEPVVRLQAVGSPSAQPALGLPKAVVANEPKQEDAASPVPENDKNSPDTALQVNYDAAVSQALTLLAERKMPEALEAMETAQTFCDTEFIRTEIAKLRQRLDQDAAARKTVNEIETVLDKGKGTEASQLATAALKEFGDGDQADKLIQVKLQADALQAVQKVEDADARFQRFKNEGDAAIQEKNLRAAALAFEQAVAAREDVALRKQLDDIRTSLQAYDDLRRKAAELRRDSNNLEDALAALNDAAKAWDTLQVRQEIDEYSLALQKRRDRVSVANFEVRGDVGIADAGKTVAEELLPTLKRRFDLVERAQIAKIMTELKLEGVPVAFDDQREIGQLAKIRYLVVGSVSQLGGIAVNARLVDVRTGLVVQTGKVVASTPQELTALLPELGKQLLMNDEEKVAYEAERAKQVKVLAPPATDTVIPPAPAIPAANQPVPPPIVMDYALPPPIGGLRLDDFRNLPPPPAPNAAIVVPASGGSAEVVVKQRMVSVALSLGDNLFRRGQYAEAQRHFDLALNLSPGHVDVRLRVERVQPLLPPPVVLVEQPVVVVPVARPRIAVLPFVVAGDPRVVPLYLSTWTPSQLTPYFAAGYDIVEPGELYWYMGSMGMSVRDVMVNPFARRWLGRALNVRYFVFGTIEQTASFNVTTHMIDAEFGYQQGTGLVHVHNPLELKLRLGELAGLTMMDPIQRARYLKEQERFDGLLVLAQKRTDAREFALAVKVYEDALLIRPNHVEVLARLTTARQRAQELAWEEARAREYALRQARLAELRRRQWALAESAESIRIKVGNISIGVEERRVIEQQRFTAQTTMAREAQLYLKIGNFELGIRKLEGAVAVAPANDALVRDLALARAQAERAALAREAQAKAQRDAALRAQQQIELARARKALEDEQALRLVAQQAARKAAQERERVEYQASFDEGRRLMSTGNYEGAIAALSAAARVRRTTEVETLLNQALVENARAAAKGKARDDLERQLAAEKAGREKAEAEAKRNQDLYLEALRQAQKAQAARNFVVARAKYQEAGKLFKTDAVLTGLKQVETGQSELLGQAQAAKQKAADDAQKDVRIQQLLKDGQASLSANKLEDAVNTLRQAKKLAPDNADVLTALTKAEQARDKSRVDAQRQSADRKRQDDFKRLLDSGKANLANKQYDAAKFALNQALVLDPGNTAAASALKEVEKALNAQGLDAKAKAEAARKADSFQKYLSEGRLALSSQRYDDAIQSFTAAQKVLPGDQTSVDFLKEAQKGKQDMLASATAAAKKRADELKLAADVKKALDDGRTALAAKKLDDAGRSFAAAATLAPKDADVARALADLDRAQKAAHADAETRQKRQTQYQALVDSGKSALAAKKYAEAIKAFNDAAALMPEDKTGQDLLRQAQKAQADAKLVEEKTLQAKLDQDRSAQVQKQYQSAIQAGQKSLAAKQYEDAIKSFNDAAKLVPTDKTAPALLAQAQKALADAKTSQTGELKRQADLAKFAKQGQDALNLKKYTEAKQAFGEALKLAPNDAHALRGQRDAQAGLEAQQTADKAKLASFTTLMQQAQAAMQAKRYRDAQKAYDDALKLFPADANAQRGLQDANRALNPPKIAPPPPPPPPKVDNYQLQMDSGAALEKQQKYADAMKAYQEALKVRPNDQKATQALRNADFNIHLTEGQKHLQARRFVEAQREFEAALRIMPNNPTATNLLNKAKQGKN